MAKERVLEKSPVLFRIEVWMKEGRVLSEKEALRLVKKGDREAYGAIVRNYMKTAYYIALGFVHNHQDALDLSQEAFIRAFRKINGFNLEKPFFPWFYKIMRNLCLDQLQRTRHRREIPLEGIRDPGLEDKDRDIKKALWKGIMELPFEQREVIILRYFRQFSYKEIAEIVGKPIGTVMSSLYYAKKRLRGILSPYFNFEEE